MVYEYRVVPAPERGQKAKGVKTPQARFALALQSVMNSMGAKGWEYQRAETLPATERAGIASTTTQFRNVLVFRRAKAGETAAPVTALIEDQTDIDPTEDETDLLQHPEDTDAPDDDTADSGESNETPRPA